MDAASCSSTSADQAPTTSCLPSSHTGRLPHWPPPSRHWPPPPDTGFGLDTSRLPSEIGHSPDTSRLPPDFGLGPDTGSLPPDTGHSPDTRCLSVTLDRGHPPDTHCLSNFVKIVVLHSQFYQNILKAISVNRPECLTLNISRLIHGFSITSRLMPYSVSHADSFCADQTFTLNGIRDWRNPSIHPSIHFLPLIRGRVACLCVCVQCASHALVFRARVGGTKKNICTRPITMILHHTDRYWGDFKLPKLTQKSCFLSSWV